MRKNKKRYFTAVLLAVILLIAATAACAETYSISDTADIPDQIRILLNKENLSGYTATSYAENSGYGFAVLQGDGNNILYVFRQINGNWFLMYRTWDALRQGKGLTLVRNDEFGSGIVITYDLTWDYNGEYDLPGFQLTEYFELQQDGVWRLKHYRDENRWISISFSNYRLSYYGGQDAEEYRGTVYGFFQTDLQYFILNNIPSSLDEARKSLTLAPSLPAGTLTAEVIRFTGGQKYAVYSGPGENYLRGADGNALVSTNDWIQVFGREGDWIMIQYAISSELCRIGYIPAKALPKNVNVNDLNPVSELRLISQSADVTDDPLFSRTPIATLPEGAEATLLGTLGDYAYIETFDSIPLRGFVPACILASPQNDED